MWEAGNITFFAGIPVGIVTAVFTLVLFHFILAPRIDFSNNVRTVWLEGKKRYRYSIRVKKIGYFDLIDMQAVCRVGIRDVRRNGKKIWNFYSIPTTYSDSLFMKSAMRYIDLKIHESDMANRQDYNLFRSGIKMYTPDDGLRFEDVFLSWEAVYVRVYIIGHDRFTGVKKLFESPKYYLHNFKHGEWSGMDIIAHPRLA